MARSKEDGNPRYKGEKGTVFVRVGRVAHYYKKLGVAAVEIDGSLIPSLERGDHIWVHGRKTSFGQIANSIEENHVRIERCMVHDQVGIKMKHPVKRNDIVYVEVVLDTINVSDFTSALSEVLPVDAIKMRQVKKLVMRIFSPLQNLKRLITKKPSLRDKLRNVTNY